MAEARDIPYGQFNFRVDLGTGDETTSKGGFQEVSGLGFEVNVAEYRSGNSKENSSQRVPGTYKVSDVTLKRGVIGADDLFKWLKQVREAKEEFRREITIKLMGEDRETIAATWTLKKAFPTKYTGPSLNGKGTDVAIEELVLACERIDMEV